MAERLSRLEKKARTRQLLLDAAAEVFAKRGFLAASIDQIAERAGMTKGAVYSNFDSKEDLVLTLMDERLYARVDNITRLADPSIALRDHASEAGRLFASLFDESSAWFLLGFEFDVYLARNPDVRARYAARYRDIRERCTKLIVEGATAAGIDLPIKPDTLVHAVFALGNGIALEKLTNDDVPDDLFPTVLSILYDGLRFQASASSDIQTNT